jgi:hypothetical protein
MPHYNIEVETCLRCGAPVDVWVVRKFSAQGELIGRLIHRFRCRGGCTGHGVLDAPGEAG